MADIRVPTLGELVTEATVGKWFKQPGEAVAVDEPLVELETDKVTLEVPAPAAGVLSDIAAKTGDTVGVAALLGQIKEGAGCRARQSRAARRQAARSAETGAGSAGEARRDAAPAVGAQNGGRKRHRRRQGRRLRHARPGHQRRHDGGDRARRRAADAGRGHRRAVQMRAPSPADDAAREERVHMTRLRQTIARRLKDAQNTAAMLTTFNEVDMGAVMALRNQYKELFEKKHGVKLGFMGFFVRACIQALKEIPAVNAEIDGTDIVYKNYYHIGVAVGTEKRPGGAGGARCRHDVARRHREGDQRFRQARARRRAQDRGDAGRHLHHQQRRRLRLADVDADPERAAVRHPRHAQDPGAAGGASAARSRRGR